MLHALPVVHPVRVMELIWGVHLPVEYVIRLQPVSYTHLDVYKRQVLHIRPL